MGRSSLALVVAFIFLAAIGKTASSQQSWQPAVVTSRSALANNRGFTIKVSVELPQSKACFNERIRATALDPHGPRYYVVEQMHTGGVCNDMITTVAVQKHFDAKPLPKSVTLAALDEKRKPHRWSIPVVFLSH